MHIYLWQTDPPNDHRSHATLLHPIRLTYSRIDNRSMLHHNTQEVSHITECTYTHDRWPFLAIEHYTQSVSHIEGCTYTHGRHTPPPAIDHRSMLHHYTQWVLHIEECRYTHGRCTPPLQSIIDPCYTITPNNFTYSRMHIYPWQTDPPKWP